ncbi:MAG: septal ring lytic transglycosylase RlpA family protein [Porticoccaceae bacterium]|nr:septal ring lytic transglycosylase RlpA family protein [Porticoccaceae bacterium]MBT7374856.1 septal ring lytic transglycosylase RlpA family protein [Porticoccaceae bacterium]
MSTANRHLGALPVILATVLGIVSCGSAPTLGPTLGPTSDRDGPGERIDISAIPNPLPKVEPITKLGNKSPYTVFGKTYQVMSSNKNYREQGVASWYGKKFHGRKTSNGEIYNMYGMTAAHKTLPIPSYVSVTNLDNNRSIVVRVNDRGPFHDARLIDLSYVGALKLGFADQGTARVLVEYLDPSQPTATENLSADSSQSASSEDPEQEAFQDRYLQVGAFNDLDSAQILQKKVQDHTSLPISVQKKDQLFKVWVGPIVGKLELQQLRKALLDAANISGFIISE